MKLVHFGSKDQNTPRRLRLVGSVAGAARTGPLNIAQGVPLVVPEDDLIENIAGVLYFTSGGVRTPIASGSESVLAAFTALGSPIKYQAVGVPLQLANSSDPLLDNRARFIGVYVPTAGVITGIKVLPTVLGNYTGDNNNRIGLYSYDSAGTLTLVASSANNANLWTSAANAIQTIPFSAPYNLVTPGMYFVALLYSNSAVVANPQFATYTGVSIGQSAIDFTFNAKLYSTILGMNDLPANQGFAGLTATSTAIWVALY